MKNLSRKIRGAIGNAVTWAANAIGAAVFGGLTAGGTVVLAQRSARQLASSASADESHLLDGQGSALGDGTGGAS